MNNGMSYILGIFLVLAIGLSVLVGPLQAQDDTGEEQNIERIRQYYDGLNDKNFTLSFFPEFYASYFSWHNIDSPLVGRDEAGVRAGPFAQLARAFPDFIFTIESITTTDDIVMVHYSFLGTLESNWRPWGNNTRICKATHEEVAWDGVTVYRLEGGLIVELWEYWDNPLVADPDVNCG